MKEGRKETTRGQRSLWGFLGTGVLGDVQGKTNQWGEGGRVTQPNKLEEMSLYHVILSESHMV